VTIAEFLLALATDPELRARFESDPESVLSDQGIEGDKARLLLAGTLRDLRIKIEGELDIDGEIIAFETIWWFRMPPPPPRP
jgi:hypothetical protein